MTVVDSCDKCTFVWAIRLPDGTITELSAGKLKELNDSSEYKDLPLKGGWLLGAFLELVGGNIGKLMTCALEKFPDVDYIDVLIEGRWRRLNIDFGDMSDIS